MQVRLRVVARTFLALGTGHILGKLVGIGSAVMLARWLDPSGLGTFAASITLVSFALIATNCGSDALGIRGVARDPDAAPAWLRAVTRLRLTLGATCALIAVAGGLAIGGKAMVVAPLATAVVVFAFRADWLLLALGRAGSVATASVVRELVFFAAVMFATRGEGSVSGGAWAYLLADVAWATTTQLMLVGRLRMKTSAYASSLPRLVRDGWPMVINSSMSLTYTKIDTPMLFVLVGTSAAGIYWSAYAILLAVMGFSTLLSRSTLPEMSRVSGVSNEVDPRLEPLILGSAVAGGAAAMLLVGSSEMLMTRLYGPSYVDGAQVLGLLALCLPMNFAAGVLLNRLVAVGRQRTLAGGSVIAAIGNVALNLGLIPLFGMKGAAVATLASEAVLLGVGLIGLESPARRGLVLHLGVIVAVCVCMATLVPRVVPVNGACLSALLVAGFLVGCLPTIIATRGRWVGHGARA